MPNRAAFTGIVFVLRSGIPWELLPRELGCGSGVTCWRRLRDWQQAGVFDRLHRALLDRLGEQGRIDWERAGLASARLPAKKGHADKAYDYPRCRRALRQRHILVRIARRGSESTQRLGRHRWVVERTVAWLDHFRRLTIEYERRRDIHEAFTILACALICWTTLTRPTRF